MQDFNSLLTKILKENQLSMVGMDSTSNGYCQLNPLIMENLFFQAIDQNQFSELTPVPKPFLNFVCSKVKTKQNFKLIITYQQIFNLLKNYQYEDVYNFKNILEQLKIYQSGYLCIGICNYNLKEFQNIFSSNQMSNNRINLFFSNCSNTHSGDTFSGDPILKANYKNTCIWLNKEFIIPYSTWKDTLSHELSHFIHRVVIFQRTTYTGKIEKSSLLSSNQWYQKLSLDDSINKKFYQIFSKLLCNYSNDILQKIISLYKGTIFKREESTVIQNILNGFQRMYQQQNIIDGRQNYKHIETNHNSINYYQQRSSFLNNLLKEINDENFFNTNKGIEVINQILNFNKNKIKSIYIQQKKFKQPIYILQYLCIKNILPEWNIDDKLKKHFKIFKFRDN